MAGAITPNREIDVSHCIETRKRMEETGDRMIMRDHKYHTGSDEWLARFNKKYLTRTSRWD